MVLSPSTARLDAGGIGVAFGVATLLLTSLLLPCTSCRTLQTSALTSTLLSSCLVIGVSSQAKRCGWAELGKRSRPAP